MKITRITAWSITVPMLKVYTQKGGRQQYDSLDSTVLKIDTDEGVSGWGESCPVGSTYLAAHPPGVRAGIETLAPSLLGNDPCALGHINRLLDAALPGHQYVKSGLDTACWDILGKVSGMPLWRLFGGASPEPVAALTSLSTASPQEMVDAMLAANACGYNTHAVKVGSVDVPGDIERIEATDAALVDGDKITYDANRGWTPATAIQVLNSTNTAHWVEQPCETIAQCAHVAARVRNPILLDESLQDFDDHLHAWRIGACEGIKVKPNRLGGLTKSIQVRDFALSVGWRMHIEDLGGCGFANIAATHLASSTPDSHRMASWIGDELLEPTILDKNAFRTVDGRLTPPSKPGIGVEPDESQLPDPIAVYE